MGAAEERDRRARLRASIVDALLEQHLLEPDDLGDDIAGLASERAVLGAVLGFTAAADADVVLVTLEDLWGETRAQNIPGTGPAVPNWRRRVERSLDDIEADSGIRALLDSVDRQRRARSGTGERTTGSMGTESR